MSLHDKAFHGHSSACRMLGSPLPACGERSTAEGGRVRGALDRPRSLKIPLTPTLSPQAGRGSAPPVPSASRPGMTEEANT
jgi:hypothetical protein